MDGAHSKGEQSPSMQAAAALMAHRGPLVRSFARMVASLEREQDASSAGIFRQPLTMFFIGAGTAEDLLKSGEFDRAELELMDRWLNLLLAETAKPAGHA